MHSSWHEWIGLGSQNTVVNHTGIQIQEIEFSWEAEDQNGRQKGSLVATSNCTLPAPFSSVAPAASRI